MDDPVKLRDTFPTNMGIRMKIYRLQKIGSINGLALCEEPTPQPGPGEVLINIKATSLNFRDLSIISGQSPFPLEEGRVQLSDAAGIVEAVGTGVTRFAVGDRVVNNFMPGWHSGSFREFTPQYGTQLDGWMAEYRAVDQNELVAIPDSISFEDAATLPCAAVTGWNAVAGVGPQHSVLTQGSGGVSLFALQFAKARGAKVIATTSSAEKAQRLLALGADHVINYAENPNWGEQAKALTDGRGVDRVVEVGGPGTFAQSLKAVALSGQVSMVGVLAQGEMPSYLEMFLTFARFQTIVTGNRQDLQDVIAAVAQNRIRPVIDSRFSFDDGKAAFEHFGKRNLFGKVVITNER
ncbi:NADPH:quinone reductase-like Zn-dependent oxidoreductase [Pseudomonas sp. BIGb0408]|uniref:NADPH:quinone reductase-like Zn-dependent oxidoreductase n=2 Tax=Pseudomonadaceae TaxID=135621 RepID=A0A7Y9XMT0_9GAMM|nr:MULTISPECIES: NAD(P)-dependent alcohol dehydrogenase [Pseudomonas]MCW2291274.1 NADPH:quinone reductase-like Zn-dependent oxidoreductase [Pseudomonas sp. BIGb0408]NYH74155.1 NADPH:quinone reductase-like Zn-dependent oxidoreductase [Pseudomonas flavescens]